MTPVTTAGVSARTMVLATVGVQNSGGYSVYLKSNSQNLVGKKTGGVIAPIVGAVAYENLATNTWGYAAAEGTTVADNATYKAVSTSGNGNLIGENTSSNITNESKTFALSFAAKIGNDKPADTYENQVILSVVSAPGQVALFGGIQTMQAMTTSVCDAAEVGDEAQLRDTRDGKMYWVSKLADGKCWMTQNLDLDLSTSKYLSPSDSDVSSNWTPGYNTATIADSSTFSTDSTSTRSWSLGNYRIIKPTGSSNCGSSKNDASQCPDQFTAYNTPTVANSDTNAHYILGNHYAWNAATAGTGGSVTSGQATGSICPKGWKLLDNSSDVSALASASGVEWKADVMTAAPFYFVRGGSVGSGGGGSGSFSSGGGTGNYWTANASSSSSASASTIDWGLSTNRYFGFSVRCIAR